MSRVRHKHSASVFVALMRNMEVCLLRQKGTGGYDNGLWPICADEFWPSIRPMIAWHRPSARTAC